MKTSVLIVEDEPEFLRRFSDAVLAEPELVLAGAVTTVAAARALIDVAAPDVVVTDLGLPDGRGTEVIRYAKHRRPESDVLVVTMFGDDASITDCIAAGATGYLLKDAQSQQIPQAILQVRAGGSPISPAIARRVLDRMRHRAPPIPPRPDDSASLAPALSDRETQILQLVAKGLSFKDVGEVLAISPHTVTTHVKKIYQKLAVHSRGEAVYEAGQLGLL